MASQVLVMVIGDWGDVGGGGYREIHLGNFSLKCCGHFSWSVQAQGFQVSLGTLPGSSSPLLPPKFPLKRPYLAYGGPHSRSGCIDLEVTWQAAPADSKSFPPLNLPHTSYLPASPTPQSLPLPPQLQGCSDQDLNISSRIWLADNFDNPEEEEGSWSWSRDIIWIQRAALAFLHSMQTQCKLKIFIITVAIIITITFTRVTIWWDARMRKKELVTLLPYPLSLFSLLPFKIS